MPKQATVMKPYIPELPADMVDKIRDYTKARSQQSTAAKAAEAAKDSADKLQAEIREAMGNATVATCENMILKLAETAGTNANVEMVGGEKIPLAAIKSFLTMNGRTLKAAAVSKLVGARNGYERLQVTSA